MWQNAWMHRAAARGRQAGLAMLVTATTLLAGVGSASRAQTLPPAESVEGLITVDAAAVVAVSVSFEPAFSFMPCTSGRLGS